MENDKKPTAAVLAVGEMAFEGHIIPHTWYDHVTYETASGKIKVDLQAIVILSDVVYWYRPRVVMDEATGKVLRWERRFSADKLQRNYQQISERFGLSKTQAARACKRLADLGLITMEFRTVETDKGPIPNVLFLEPVPERLAEITFARGSLQIRKDMSAKKSGHTGKNVRTNTKNASENTPKKKSSAQAPTPPPDEPLPGTEEPWPKDEGPPDAARVFHNRTGRWPKRTLYRRIHDAVDDLEFWGEVVATYVALGWNPTNVDGMLDWYKRRELPKVTPKGNGGLTHASSMNALLSARQRRLEQEQGKVVIL